MEFGKPRPFLPPPILIEHARPIMLLERLIQETLGDLDGLDAYCEMFRKSDEWKEKEKNKLQQRLNKLQDLWAQHICALTPYNINWH